MKNNIIKDKKVFEVRDVEFYFIKEKPVLRGISFCVNYNDFIVIAGANGSGKTVLMKHLNGLLKPTNGTISLYGKNIFSDIKMVRQKVGLVFQNSDTQIVGQTVYDEIAFGPRNLGWNKEKVKESVEKAAFHLGISHLFREQPHFLSGGEKKKVAIAGVLVMEPEVVILDEPFAGLDYEGVKTVTKEIVSLHNKGCAVIVISHDMEKILGHAERFIIIKKGIISYDGIPDSDPVLFKENHLRIPFGNRREVKSYTWLD